LFTVSVLAPLWHLMVEATGNFSFHVAALSEVRVSVPSSVRAISYDVPGLRLTMLPR